MRLNNPDVLKNSLIAYELTYHEGNNLLWAYAAVTSVLWLIAWLI